MNGMPYPPPPGDYGYRGHTGHRGAYDPSPRPKKGSVRTKIAMSVAVVSIGIAGGALWAGLGPGTPTAAASSVHLEPTASAGASPFMTPVGQDQPGVTPPEGTSGAFAGDTPGLFGESGGQPSCDAATLIGNLQADPAKSGAWAEAVGITVEEIPGYVGTLNPVVLRSDTAVTSYGYENSTFVAYPAVLQAGTAVFVNGTGEPRVKCFSGNPLGQAPDVAQAAYVGPSWGYFAPASVTYVTPARTVIKNYTVIDIDHGRSHHRPGKPGWPGGDGGFCKHHPESDKCGGGGGKPRPNPELEKNAKEAAEAAKKAGESAKTAEDAAKAAKTGADAATTDFTGKNTVSTKDDQAADAAEQQAKELQAAADRETNPLSKAQKQISAAIAAQAAAVARDKANKSQAETDKAKAAKDEADKKVTEADTAAKKAGEDAEKAKKEAEEAQKKADEAAGRKPGKGEGAEAEKAEAEKAEAEKVDGKEAKDGAKDGAEEAKDGAENAEGAKAGAEGAKARAGNAEEKQALLPGKGEATDDTAEGRTAEGKIDKLAVDPATNPDRAKEADEAAKRAQVEQAAKKADEAAKRAQVEQAAKKADEAAKRAQAEQAAKKAQQATNRAQAEKIKKAEQAAKRAQVERQQGELSSGGSVQGEQPGRHLPKVQTQVPAKLIEPAEGPTRQAPTGGSPGRSSDSGGQDDGGE